MGAHFSARDAATDQWDRPPVPPAPPYYSPQTAECHAPADYYDPVEPWYTRITWPMVGMAWVIGVVLVSLTLAIVGDTRRANSCMSMTLIIGLIAAFVAYKMRNNSHSE